MDVETAIEMQIEPVLAETFGPSFARCLATMATLDFITAGGGNTLRYRAFVDSVCSSERVLEKWGPELAKKKCQEWKDLVPLEPEPVVILSSKSS
jgi:hypothetical protein